MRIDLPDRLDDGEVALRPMRASDATPAAAAFRADPQLGVFLGLEEDPDEARMRSRIEAAPGEAEEGTSVLLAVADAATDAFMGEVLLYMFAWKHQRCEIGFWLAEPYRRRGAGVRAVALALDWVFRTLDIARVEMNTTPDNPAVPSLAAGLGFTREGTLRARNLERGRRVDVVWFGLLRQEWARA